ncbi:hypothetical protein EW026_g5857 [Hermanssonia centrifuga]|uniref:non-specific serine/threonine protein kinase n=1 Tax=Hermanssonia centrifuga TaxID=98765 RepID=A0A4V3X9X8_9APHY|nr:hypothetical protein EW026_g5857 [Hermanssonia centrifuga]
MYKWYTAFPQIVSRVGHDNPEVYTVLSSLIVYVIQEYPQQGLWLFAAVVNSQKDARSKRGRSILDKLRGAGDGNMNKLISASLSMAAELLNLCNGQLGDKSSVNMSKDFPRLFKLAPSPLIIPLQQSLTATLPPLSSTQVKDHKPFPIELPTFYKFSDEIEIMKSLAKPRKICIQGSDGHFYLFLGKPKDDLRKDAALMDFNSVINKLLKSNSESRRRQLRIRTYGVVTLNEECGFIQWVHNTVPLGELSVAKLSAELMIFRLENAQMGSIFGRIKQSPDKDAANLFVHEILPMFPPVLHEWFIEMFPEPSAWLAGRLTYSRTVAVMSMIGAILGLGDRHCENILLDMNSGDVVHVDFNCLFDKGRQLETPERVPFRLTQNMTDGLGVIGVEGVFRTACEITIQLLRDNRDCLMSVLDSFVHDPLVEWEEEHMKEQRRRQASSSSRKFDANVLPDTVNLRNLAKNALGIIGKKLKGIYTVNRTAAKEKELSTSGFVQILIQQATDEAFLAKMYPGWAPWH